MNDRQKERARRKHALWEMEMLASYGWYSHIVDDPNMPTGMNFHTHGLDLSWGHRDIQIVIPYPEICRGVSICIVESIKKGMKFQAGETYDKILKDKSVKFVNAKDGKRDVLRVIFPDLNDHLEKFNMTEPFDQQYEGVEE